MVETACVQRKARRRERRPVVDGDDEGSEMDGRIGSAYVDWKIA
jgi:hypothetical protein